MSAASSASSSSQSSGRELASQILLGLAIVGSIVTLFYHPFEIAPPSVILALVGVSITGKNRRFGMATTLFATLCFLIGASIAIWYSRSLY